MARNRINLNRFRKIYPQMRKSPVFWYKEQEGIPLEVVTVSGGGANYDYTTTIAYMSPVVVATAEENVNVWVSQIQHNGGGFFTISVRTSDVDYTGDIHIQIGEGNA